MLKDDLYTLQKLEHAEGTVTATLLLHAAHPIFAGHYPGQPVLPGACLLQIVHEVTDVAFGQFLKLIKANSLKFLAMIDPETDATLQLKVSYQEVDSLQIKVNATVLVNEVVGFKLQGLYQRIVQG